MASGVQLLEKTKTLPLHPAGADLATVAPMAHFLRIGELRGNGIALQAPAGYGRILPTDAGCLRILAGTVPFEAADMAYELEAVFGLDAAGAAVGPARAAIMAAADGYYGDPGRTDAGDGAMLDRLIRTLRSRA